MSFYVLPNTPSAADSLLSTELELSNHPPISRNPIYKYSGLCFIYSGFLPVGRFLYRSYCSNANNVSKHIHEVRSLIISQESMIHGSASEVLLAIRRFIQSYSCFSGLDIIRIMIKTCDPFYSSFTSSLMFNHWCHVSSLRYIHCQPSISLDYWQTQYSLLEKIYIRNKRSSIRLVQFSALSSSEWNFIRAASHPMWASPSHPSLETECSSLSSYAAFLGDRPCAWFIANDQNKNLLSLETMWIDKSICSSAILYSMIFLSFSSFFGYSPSFHRSFHFVYLTSNNKMRVFSEWLKPFQASCSLIHTFDLNISSGQVAA